MSLTRKIASTFSFKLLGAILNLVSVILISRFLGPGGKGETSLFIADLTIVLLFTGVLGGTALIYLTPRRNIYQLILPAYAGAALCCLTLPFLLRDPGRTIPVLHLGCLSLLHALFTIHAMILLGKQQVSRYNQLTFLQALLIVAGLAFSFYWGQEENLMVFIGALYGSYGTVCLLSFWYLLRLPDRPAWTGFRITLTDLVRHGTTGQLANLVSFVNNRLGFYLLGYFYTTASVGIYSIGVSLAEGLWLIGRSMAQVQYSRVANSPDQERSRRETWQLARLNAGLTFLAWVALALIPENWYLRVFGEAFAGLKMVILALGPGIVAVSLGNLFIHYFSGTGRYQYNLYGALLALAITLPGAYWLIRSQGLVGAAILFSLSQVAATLLLTHLFFRKK